MVQQDIERVWQQLIAQCPHTIEGYPIVSYRDFCAAMQSTPTDTDLIDTSIGADSGSRASHRANSSVVSTKGFDPGEKWTPGPWRVEEGTTLVWGACDPADRSTYGMGYPVTQARVRLGAATEYASEFREDEAEANARLIAAAPALYEALENILDCAFDGPAYDAAVAALRKARGEQ